MFPLSIPPIVHYTIVHWVYRSSKDTLKYHACVYLPIWCHNVSVYVEGYGKMAYTKRCIYAIQEAFIPSMCPVACDGILGSPSPFLCGIIVSKDTKTIQNKCRYPPHLLKVGCAWCDPHMQEVCTSLVLEAPCVFWPALLACAAPFSMFFLGSSSVFSTILHGPALIFA